MGMAQPQDAFAAWLEAFVQDNDLLMSDDDDQLARPDTQLLIAQLQQVPAPAELLPELDMAAALDDVDCVPQQATRAAAVPLQQLDQQHGVSHGGSCSSSKQASDSKGTHLRLKNTKRYKSQAQKDAHKRYRERKKQNISTMEQDVVAKQQLLQKLQAENAALQSKLRVLETSLDCSTQIHGLMQLIEDVDRLGISSSSHEESGTGGSSSFGSHSRRVAGAAAVSAVPAMPGVDAGLSRSIGSASSGSSSAEAAGSGLDATASSVSLPEKQQQDQSVGQPWAPQQQQQQRMAEAYQLQQRHQTALPSGSSSVPAPTLSGSNAVAGDASSSLQAIFADAQQQQERQKALSSSGIAAGGAAAAAAADAACDTAPLSGQINSPEQGVALYKVFLGKARVLMTQRSCSDPVVAAAADARLDTLMRSAVAEVFQPFLVAKGQGVVYDMSTRSLETMQPAEPPEQLWPAVLQAMDLNPQQQQDALACYRMFGACLSRLVDQRLALNAQYKALQQAEEAADRVSKLLLRAHSLEVLQAISKSLAAYSSLDGVFAHSVTSIISGSQMAVACVTSYPWLPQWHRIMAVLQRQDEAAQAAAVGAARVQPAPKQTARRGRPPRSTQLLGVQHTLRT